MMHRRRLLAAGAAALAAPLSPAAAEGGWARIESRAAALDQLHAIAAWVDGEEVLRARIRGPGLGAAVNVKSVAKTWVAACLGAAIDRGEVPGLDATIGDLAPGLIPAGADPAVAGITVENLAAMQAGLGRTSGANYGGWIASANWVADALGRPMAAEPGGRMLYSTGSSHILGAVLTEVTGLTLLEQMRGRLAGPLGVEIPAWVRDPQGYHLGGNQMAMTLDAMLRFGEMHRRGGLWDGARVLSEDWVEASRTPRTRSPWSGLGYGLGWFLGSEAGAGFSLARGYGGQLIATGPRLVLAITSDPTRPARSAGYFGDLMEIVRGAMRLTAAA